MRVGRIVVVMAALAIMTGAPAVAQAKSHKKHSHDASGTIRFAGISFTGMPPATGSEVFAGTSEGALGSGAIRGALTFTAPTFSGSFTLFGRHGSITGTLKGTGTVNPDGSITTTGTGSYTGGTGTYKGARGSLTFTSITPAGPTGSNQPTTVTTTKATVRY